MTGGETRSTRALGDAVPLSDAAAMLGVAPEVLHLMTDARELSDLRLTRADPARPWVLLDEVSGLDPEESRASLRAALALWTYLRFCEPCQERTVAQHTNRPLWVRTGRRGTLWNFGIAVRAAAITDWLISEQRTAVITTRFRLEPFLDRSPWTLKRLIVPAAARGQESFPSYLAPDWVIESVHRFWSAPDFGSVDRADGSDGTASTASTASTGASDGA